jgi:dihydroorotate dehydrogenase electron transfer subunit
VKEIRTFKSVKIEFNRKLTSELFHLRLAGNLCADFSPGQFVMIRVRQATDPLLARPFSLLRADSDGFEIVYRVVGRGTSILADKKAADSVWAFGPLGHGFDPDANSHAIMLAGGVGMPPLYSLAEAMIENGTNPKKITLCYGACTARELIMTEEIEKLDVELRLSTDDGSCGHRGFATDLIDDSIAKHATGKNPSATVYACGPEPMMAAAANICREKGLALQVSLERRFACGFGVCLGCAVALKQGGYARACTEGPVFEATQIDWKNNG